MLLKKVVESKREQFSLLVFFVLSNFNSDHNPKITLIHTRATVGIKIQLRQALLPYVSKILEAGIFGVGAFAASLLSSSGRSELFSAVA